MIAASQYPDFLRLHLVYEAVLSVDPSRPASAQLVPERFRFTKASEGVAMQFSNEPDHPQRLSAVLPYPHARSSNADGSNSKLLNCVLEQNPVLPRFRFEAGPSSSRT